MRVLSLLLLASAQVLAADPKSERDRAFEDLVLADLHRPFPTDADLSKRFADHCKEFEQLVEMAKSDKEVVRIAPDFTWTTSSVAWPRPDSELGFSKDRWDTYRRLFRTLSIEAGILRPWQHRDAVYLLIQTKGLVTGGSMKGYAYSEVPLEPQCDSLDKPEAVHTEVCFKPLGSSWYLVLEQD
jgi:hypothetical protein